MIDRKALLEDLKRLLRELEADLRQRAEPGGETPQVHQALEAEYKKARDAQRTAASFEEYRAEQITQKGVAWILSCVFARFLEDNALVDPPRIAGPGQALQRARDEHELYFRDHPKETDREYLLDVFATLGKLPGGRDAFGPHNAIHIFPGWLSGDAAGQVLAFFQKIDATTGALVHDFTDPDWDTRFLGDLYQDLSEAVRKQYALLQTPEFVEAFILDRTLEPALDEFGLSAPAIKNHDGDEIAPVGFRMIDPACGSAHLLLGSFDRIFDRWLKKEPSGNLRDLAQRTLDSIYGVDINPYAVAIARFRLLLRAMKACKITRLADCPAFEINLACGDSLLHGAVSGEQLVMGFHELAHHYQSEDIQELRRILKAGQYHTVVANPPYITVKDKALNQAYRDRYPEVCHMKYSLSAPFLQRIFALACGRGYTGQITANSFMKREFGKKMVETYLPRIDLTHVIDTSGAYLPGFGTPTVILFGRNRRPVAPILRAVMGIKGEPSTPADASQGHVWTAIIQQIDRVGSQSDFVSVIDADRGAFTKHPWSIGGGGAAELKQFLDEKKVRLLGDDTTSIGIASFTLEDDAFLLPGAAAARHSIPRQFLRMNISGESLRDWQVRECDLAVFPYGDDFSPIPEVVDDPCLRHLWLSRTCLAHNFMFAGKTKIQCGLKWYEYGRLTYHKLQTPLSIVFANIATHFHACMDHGGHLFNTTSPIIKLPAIASEQDHVAFVGLLNSSTACFWLKQVCHNKGSTVDQHGARQRTDPFEDFYAYSGTRLEQFPLPFEFPIAIARQLDALSHKLMASLPNMVVREIVPTAALLADRHEQFDDTLEQLISGQEELDWMCYGLYGLVSDSPLCENPPPIKLGQRAFEIVMARKMAVGEEETTWFVRHGSTPITEIPVEWPEEYKHVVQRRIEVIESDRNIALIERPEYKRRWNTEPWDSQVERALREWLLGRVESYFDLDGRMNDDGKPTARVETALTTTTRVADVARADEEFMQVGQIYRGRPDFDVANLVAELVEEESVPLLPACRYKPAGMDKRAAWERTWALQRVEDAIDALFDGKRLKGIGSKDLDRQFASDVDAVVTLDDKGMPRWYGLGSEAAVQMSGQRGWLLEQVREAHAAVGSAVGSGLKVDGEGVRADLAKRAKAGKARVVGDIPVPPKYTSADFQSGPCWRHRGKLDVPKERWVGFPYCEGEDQSLLIAWAGYNHLQLAQAIAAHYVEVQEKTGGRGDKRLEILLACLLELLPWLKQWHNDIDPEYNQRMGDYYGSFIADEARQMGKTLDDLRAWAPPTKAKGRKSKR